jgi:hypothetical protein
VISGAEALLSPANWDISFIKSRVLVGPWSEVVANCLVNRAACLKKLESDN